jgi:GNAT superfamily N-acetyltransferase
VSEAPAIRVERVESRAALDAWIRFPYSIYPPDSAWVAPLESDMRRLLDSRRNPFFRHGEAIPLLAVDAATGAPLGRILTHVFHRHNVLHGERAVFFGYPELADRADVAVALVGAAARQAAAWGGDTLRGPFNMTAMQEMGVLTGSFDASPAVDMVYTAPHVFDRLRGARLRPVFPATTYRMDDVAGLSSEALLGPRHRSLLEDPKWRFRAAHGDRLDRELETLRELLNQSFARNPHFVPITQDEFAFQIGPYRRLLDLELCRVAERDGVPVGFIVAVPDFNPLLKRMRGRSGPRELLGFLLRRRHVRDVVLIVMGVHPAYQGTGVMRVLHAQLIEAMQRRGYRGLSVTWVAEENGASNATLRALGLQPLHHVTLFEAPVAALLDGVPEKSGA